jgi:hypothetical protein
VTRSGALHRHRLRLPPLPPCAAVRQPQNARSFGSCNLAKQRCHHTHNTSTPLPLPNPNLQFNGFTLQLLTTFEKTEEWRPSFDLHLHAHRLKKRSYLQLRSNPCAGSTKTAMRDDGPEKSKSMKRPRSAFLPERNQLRSPTSLRIDTWM